MKKLYYLLLIIIFLLLSCKLFLSNSSPSAIFIIIPPTGNIDTIFSFDASESTDEEDSTNELKVRWDWDNDGIYDTDWILDKTATHQYDSIGDYHVKLEVKDSEGSTDVTSKLLSVVNIVPTGSFTISPTQGDIATVFTFDASGSTDDEDAIDYLKVRWDWENDDIFDTDWSTIKTTTHQYNSIGDYNVKLEVKDSNDSTNIAIKSLNVYNTPPTALFTINPSGGTTSTIFTFDASRSTDAEDNTDILELRWDWESDGTFDTNWNVNKIETHQYMSVSNKTVTLEVRDTWGLTDTVSLSFEVLIGCGAYIVEDTILNEDLDCSSDEIATLRINTSNVILDLNGHTITNTSSNPLKNGIEVWGVNNVTIKNGTLDGFLFGILTEFVENITIENVTIKNMRIAHPDTFVFGIQTAGSNNFNVKNCQFEFPKVAHKTAVISYGSNINVDNIQLNGGSVGVNWSLINTCSPGGLNHSNGGVVTNSTFTDATIAGVLVACTNDALIQGNEFIRNECGVQVYGPEFGSIQNLTIDDNYIHDGYIGIDFFGVTESTITNNIIQDGWRGIMMNQCHECLLGIQPNPFYSTGNTISNNVVTGHLIDLWHHEQAVGNTWINNTCQTSEGDEIPECSD